MERVAASILDVADASGVRTLVRAAGWTEPPALDVEAVAQAITTLAATLRPTLENPPTDLPGLATLAGQLGKPLGTLGAAVQALGAPPELVTDVAETLVVAAAARAGPLLPILELLGVAERVAVPALESGGWRRSASTRTRINPDRVGQVLADPLAALRAIAANPDALVAAAWPLLVDLLAQLDIGADTADMGPTDPLAALARRILVVDLPVDKVPPEFVRLAVGVGLDPAGQLEAFAVASPGLAWQGARGGWQATVNVPGPQRVRLSRAGVVLENGAASIAVDIRYRSSGSPAFRLGSAQGTALTVGSIEVDLSFRPTGPPDIGGRIALKNIGVQLAGADGDSFLAQTLPAGQARPGGDLELSWSLRTGLKVAGRLDLQWQSGPVLLELVPTEAGLDAVAAATLAVNLGPVKATIDQVGLRAGLSFPAGGGNLGPARLGLDFKPPSGVALSIDAGAVVGGGFLFFDHAKAQYAGAVHLEFSGITLNAIGLLTTRMPDGSRGFSLLVIVTASGFAPIPLGFGFNLTGVGGLLGIHRTTATQVLRDGLRQRTLDAVLFSKDDPTPRALQLVGVLQNVFPPARDRFLFGPMAVLTWGTPAVLTLEIALLLELPAPLRLILLGRLRVLLPGPDEKLAVVKLNLDVLGVVEFDRGQLSIDGTLYDSMVAGFAVTGDMAVRASFGERPDFVLAIGGFHPRFQPPAGFPALRRLTLTLSSSTNPRLRLEAYLALTPNTLQFGARLDLYVEVSGFSVAGVISFDALVQFAPFQIQADLMGSLALKRGTTTLLAITIKLALTGPAPWHAIGEGTFEVLFFKATVRFEARFGEARPQALPASVDIWPLLRAALVDPRNWTSALPPAGGRLVTLAGATPAAGEVLVHPLGELSVSQRVVPLERDVSRFANAPPLRERRFAVVSVQLGTGAAIVPQPAFEQFAPAQFFELSDAQKLASPSFDPMPSGAKVPGGVVAGPEHAVTLRFETLVVEPPGQPPARPLSTTYTPPAPTVTRLAETGAAAVSELRATGRGKFARVTAGVEVVGTRFTVASKESLRPVYEAPTVDGSWSGAAQALGRLVAQHPEERTRVQVAPRHEALV
jgi:hypothetical protein